MVEYRIYADNYLIYSSLTPEIAGLVQPKLKVEVNKSGSLSFTMPSNHEYFDDIHPMKTLILVYQGNDILFRGRVIEAKIDFFKQKKVTCEGDLSFLLDSVIRPFEYIGESKKKTIRQVFKKVIDDHNAQMIENSTWKRFSYDDSHITVTIDETKDVNATDEWNYTSFGDTSSVLNSEFLDVYGGLLMTRTVNQNGSLVTYLDYIKDPSQNPSGFITNQQEIEFGVNLLELDSSYPVSDIFTVLMPIGSDKLTIEDVNNNSPYLENQAAIAKFGRIVKVEQWSDVKKADELKQKGQKFLDQHGAIFSDDLTVKAIDLHYLGQSNHPLKLLDKVAVYSDPHDINTVLLCLSVEYDLQNPENNSYKLGTYIPSDKHKGKTKKSGGGGGGRGGGGGTPALSDTLNDDEEEIHYNKEGSIIENVQNGKNFLATIGDKAADILGIDTSSSDWTDLNPVEKAKEMWDNLGKEVEVGGEDVWVNEITDIFDVGKYTETRDSSGKITSSSGIKTLSETTNDIVKIDGDVVNINGRKIVIGGEEIQIGGETVEISGKITLTDAISQLIVDDLKANQIEGFVINAATGIKTNTIEATGSVKIPDLTQGGDSSYAVNFTALQYHLNSYGYVRAYDLGQKTLDANFQSLKIMDDVVATHVWVEAKVANKTLDGNFNSLQIQDKDVATRNWTETKIGNKTLAGNFDSLQIQDKDVATHDWVETKIGNKTLAGNFDTLQIKDKDVATQEWVTGQIPVQQAYSRVYLNGSGSMASIVRMKEVTINGVNVYAPN